TEGSAQLAVDALDLGRILESFDDRPIAAAVIAAAHEQQRQSHRRSGVDSHHVLLPLRQFGSRAAASAVPQRGEECVAYMRATSSATRSGDSGSVKIACSLPSGPSSATLAV